MRPLRTAEREVSHTGNYLPLISTEQTDAVVIGGGVAGLAVARALALAGREVIILESESTIGTGTSSRNSEVIHAGIGVHLTLDLAGGARFGPDVEWVERIDYDVDPRRAQVFYDAIRSYWPGLKDGALQPAYSGIRPKLQARGQPASDFLIQGPGHHGVPGLVNLFGIESPGLTAALAIGDHVRELLRG